MLRTPAVVLALVVAVRAGAHANPAGDVTSRDAPGGAAGVRVDADYELEIDSAAIAREHVAGSGPDALAPVVPRRELEFHQTRHLVTPRAELAIYRDLWVSIAVPIVLAESTEIDLAGGVDRATASTFTDGLLPLAGFDARNPAAPPTGSLVFHGVNRSGVRELRGGIGYAPMSQARDDTQPTWKLGIDLHAAIGRAMRFDAVSPGRETGVSSGVHELRLWTSFDRRLRYFEGWFEAAYQFPLFTRSTALFQDPGFGATSVGLAQTARAGFGVEAFLTDDAATGTRVSAELAGELTAHFEGRGYSEMWEVFAFAGDRRTAGPLVLDADPVTPGSQDVSHPGITNLENYLETAVRLALRARLGRRVSLAARGALIWRTDHVISFTDAGVDLPTCSTGAMPCETDDNVLVNPGTREVNPLHVRRIDLVGHRYHAEAGRGYVIGATASVAF